MMTALDEMMKAAHTSPQAKDGKRQRAKPMEPRGDLSHKITMAATKPRRVHKTTWYRTRVVSLAGSPKILDAGLARRAMPPSATHSPTTVGHRRCFASALIVVI